MILKLAHDPTSNLICKLQVSLHNKLQCSRKMRGWECSKAPKYHQISKEPTTHLKSYYHQAPNLRLSLLFVSFSSSSFHVCAWDTLEPWPLETKRFLDQILREEVGKYFTLVQIFLCFFILGVWLKNNFAISFKILELNKSPCLHPVFGLAFTPIPSFRDIHEVRKLY
jgi:hypothetical protein